MKLLPMSRRADDAMAQECGRDFGMKTGDFRGGGPAGPFHGAIAPQRSLAGMVRGERVLSRLAIREK
jgi:hypothetical protein